MNSLRFSRQEKFLLFCLAFIQFSHIVDFMILAPMGPTLMRIFAITPHQFGLLISTYTLAAAVSGLMAAFFVDKYDRKKSLLFFYFGFCISTIACALAENYTALLFTRTLTGAFGGVLGSLVMSMVGDAIRPELRGSATGIITTAFSMASVFGVPFALFLSQKFDWHAPFLFLGVLSLMLTAGISLAIPSMRQHLEKAKKEHAWSVIQGILTNSHQVLAIVFLMMLILGQFSIIPFFSPSLVANGGLHENQLPWVYSAGGVMSIISAPLIGRMADRIGKKKVFMVGASFSLLPFFLVTQLRESSLAYILFITVMFFLSMGGRMIPAQAMVTGVVPAHHRGTFMSLASSAVNFSSAIGSYLAGIIIVKSTDGKLLNYDFVGYTALILTIVSLIMVGKLKTDVS